MLCMNGVVQVILSKAYCVILIVCCSYVMYSILCNSNCVVLVIPYVAKCSRSIIFANFANGAHSRILLFANLYVHRYTV